MKTHDEWIIGESTTGERWYVIHTGAPRFVCELYEADDDEATLAPFCYAAGDYQLANFAWIDDPPAGKALERLLADACAVAAAYDERGEALDAATTLGERLRAARENADLSRAGLARELLDQQGYAVDSHTIYRWERGQSQPDEATIRELAEFFDVTPGWLRYGE